MEYCSSSKKVTKTTNPQKMNVFPISHVLNNLMINERQEDKEP